MDGRRIGTPDDNGHNGEVFIYRYSEGGWHQQADLKAHPGDYIFGEHVAIYGNTAVVLSDTDVVDAAAYVYVRSVGWSQQPQISGPVSSVAIRRDMIVLGVPDLRHANGKVLIYKHSVDGWSPEVILPQPDRVRNSGFGSTVAISGTRLIVSAPNQGRKACGAAYEFLRSGATWRYKAQVINPDCTDSDFFGYSLAIFGRTAVIGAPDKNNLEPLLQ
jgi:hypothetical protein